MEFKTRFILRILSLLHKSSFSDCVKLFGWPFPCISLSRRWERSNSSVIRKFKSCIAWGNVTSEILWIFSKWACILSLSIKTIKRTPHQHLFSLARGRNWWSQKNISNLSNLWKTQRTWIFHSTEPSLAPQSPSELRLLFQVPEPRACEHHRVYTKGTHFPKLQQCRKPSSYAVSKNP